MATPSADQNLLFGILALQMDFIGRDQLVAAMHAWVLDKTSALGAILVRHGALNDDRRRLLDALVREHLKHYGDDAHKSLAVLASVASVQKRLREIEDPDLDRSLAHVPAGPGAAPDPDATRAGTVPAAAAGQRYRILRPHARGGLGQVSVAHDQELSREVALKEILDRHADNQENRGRFLLEAEITGGLEHPGIVPVYGLGHYDDGRPYYAMRFIRGQSLQEAIARFHSSDSAVTADRYSGMEFRQLLGRFVDVCNALEYAHCRRVLHRDLKPGNIMLGDYGETLVVDWGVAKPMGSVESNIATKERPLEPPSASGTAATQMGAALGTPAYSSPEQASGDLDKLGPASDIYSLGATLYCLLTGQAPYRGADAYQILDQVRRGHYARPRQLNPGVPPPLEAICLKAMADKPEGRYATAKALADDVEHWLADEPVGAWREPWQVRLGRWTRRHQTLLAATAVLVGTALVALTVSAVLIWREQARTDHQRRLAEANFQTALQAVDDMLTEVAQEQLAYEPGMEAKRRVLLDKARSYYQDFLDQKNDDPHLRVQTALAFHRLADIDRLLGKSQDAQRHYEQAVARLEAIPAELAPKTDLRLARAESLTYLGEVHRLASRPAEALAAYQQALALAGDEAGKPRDPAAYARVRARIHYNRGILFKDTGKPEQAQRELQAAIHVMTEQSDPSPAVLQHLARAYLNLGPVLRELRQPERALDLYDKAIDIQQQLMQQSNNPDYRHELGVTLNNKGFLLKKREAFAEAAQCFEESRKHFETLSAQFGGVPVYRKELANAQNNLAGSLIKLDRKVDAEKHWLEARARFEKLAAEFQDVPDYQGSLGMVLGNLGWLKLHDQQPAAAVPLLTKGIELVRVALKPNPANPTYLGILRDQHEYLAEALLKTKRPIEAAAAAQQLPVLVPHGSQQVLAARFLARIADQLNDDAKTQADYRERAVQLLTTAVEGGHATQATLNDGVFQGLRHLGAFQRLLRDGK